MTKLKYRTKRGTRPKPAWAVKFGDRFPVFGLDKPVTVSRVASVGSGFRYETRTAEGVPGPLFEAHQDAVVKVCT